MKKSVVISIVVLISVVVLLGGYFFLFSTVTYNGVIVSSNSTDNYIEFTIKDEKTNEQFTILADEHTDVYYCHLESDIYLGDLMNKEDCTVKISCKRYFNNNKRAESIVVQFVHENENDDF